MRLQKHINEKKYDSLEEFIEIIKKDCKPYLKLIKGKDHPLVRGMEFYEAFGKKNVRQDRTPKATNCQAFEKFNKWLQKNKHNRRDKSVICTSDGDWAASFGGNTYFIFPIGRMSYTWVKSQDVNRGDSESGWSAWAVERFFGYDDDNGNLPNPFETYFRTDIGFDTAYRKEYEIWINCKEYYYIHVDEYNDHYEIMEF